MSDPVIAWENIEGMLRLSFQAGQAFGMVQSGQAIPLSDPPANEDMFIQKAKQNYFSAAIIKMGEEALKQNHPDIHAELHTGDDNG